MKFLPASDHIVRVRVADLKIDESYQRSVDEKRVNLIASAWREELAGVITVSRRPDGLYVADGMHRFLAARRAGVEWIDARLHVALTQSQEASLFKQLNITSKKPNTAYLFRAAVVAGEPGPSEISNICRSLGISIVEGGRSSLSPMATRAVGAMQSIYGLVGPDGLRYTLKTAIAAWPNDPHALDATIIRAIGGFLFIYGKHPAANTARLSAKLAERPAVAFIQRTQLLSGMSVNAGSGQSDLKSGLILAVVEAHNRGLRSSNRLPEYTQSDMRAILRGRNPWIEDRDDAA